MFRRIPGKNLFWLVLLSLLLAGREPGTPGSPHSAVAGGNYLIAFTSAVDIDFLSIERGGIFVIRPDGTGLRQLTSFKTINYDFEPHGLNLPDDHPAFSPDGTKIAFASNRADPNNWDIYVMDVNGSDVKRLTSTIGLDTEPVFSPDGTKIAFASERTGNLDIWVMNAADGSNPVRLTSSPLEEIEPAWSPDGSQIAFGRVQSEHEKDVFIMDANGSNIRQLTDVPGEDHDPTFSPDGTQLVITSERSGTNPFGDVFKIRVSDGVSLGNLTSGLNRGGGDPAWSPDGSQVAFFRSALPFLPAPQQLWLMNADGTNYQRLDNENDLGILNIHPNWGVMADSDGDGRPNYLENDNISFGQSDFLTTDTTGDQLGAAVALADFNHDGFLDLFAGIPGENVGSTADAGRIARILGSPAGPVFIHALYLGLPSILEADDVGGALQANGRFGQTMVACDFNGDGYRDIAVGAPGQNRVFVNTYYLTAWQQLSGSGAFGAALAAADFNRDGRCDLAVGAPQDTRLVLGVPRLAAGSVRVFYGTASGLSTTPQIFDQGDLPLVADAGREEANDHFGYALAAGDLTGDFAAELAIGVPGESIGAVGNAGLVHIVRGAAGQQLQLNQAVARDGRSLPTPHTGLQNNAQFGEVLAMGDFNGDIFDIHDLVVGIPQQDVSSTADAGLVALYSGILGSSDIVATTATAFTSAGAGGGALASNRFGQTLAVGDISGDVVDDLAVAAPHQAVSSFSQAGQVYLIFGSRASTAACTFCVPTSPIFGVGGGGLVPAAAQRITQPQVGRALAANDHFGASLLLPSANTLAAADLDDDGQDDLLIGTPEEDIAGLSNSGLVSVRYGVRVGTSVLTPRYGASQADEPVTFTLTWTHPERWRDLETLHFRLRSTEGVVFWVRYDEADNLFSLFDPVTGTFAGTAEPGSAVVLETEAAAFNVEQSSVVGSGPEARDVTFTFNVNFKAPTTGRIYSVELMVLDDHGNNQGFEAIGAWGVGPFAVYLPTALR